MRSRTVLIAALQAAGLYAAGFIIPFLGQIAVLFVPVPILLAWATAGRREGIAALLLSGSIVAVLSWWQAGPIVFFLGFGLMAAGLAEGMLRGFKPERAVLLGTLLPLLGLSTVLLVHFLEIGKSPVPVVEEYLRASIADAVKLYTTMGLAEAAAMLSALSDTFVYYVVRLLPGIILVTTVSQALFCYGFARVVILRRQAAPAVPLAMQPALAAWHAPDSWVWGLIVSLGLIALPGAAQLIGLNIVILYLLVYTIQGVAVLEFWLKKAKLPALARSALIALILALPLVVGVIAAGVVDIWADFRKVRTEQHEGGKLGR